MNVTSEVRRKARLGELGGGRERELAKAVRLTIGATAVLIFTALPLQAQTESVLHSFAGPTADGGSPSGSLVRDASGNLYGTTQNGGASNLGTVFKLHPNGDGSYTESVLYSFTGTGGDGQVPLTGLVADGSGNLYGTTQSGGGSTACFNGCGTVFELRPNADGTYTPSVLHSFAGHPDGQSPGNLLIDTSGNLYGTTEFGGTATSATVCKTGCGTVFELANNSGSYTYSALFSFPVNDFYGINPQGHLAIDSTGNLYGTNTTGFGVNTSGVAPTCTLALGCGTVFELANNSGVYSPKLLYSFAGTPDADLPVSGLITDAQGNLYGTAGGGASTACTNGINGCGTVFKLHPNGDGSYTESVLYSFMGSPDGVNPEDLALDASGNLYGDTSAGGALTAGLAYGTVFKLHLNGDGTYSETVLYSFTGSPDGSLPSTGLVMDPSGNLYGTTVSGGTSTVCSLSGCGTVFEITPGTGVTTYVFSATTGSGQSATVGTAFALPLQVIVQDGSGHAPPSPITVTFTATAGASGASGTFASGATTTAPTNSSGVATTSVFTANGTVGGYTVTATAPNVTGSATFSLTNLAAAVQTTTTFTTSSTYHGQTLPSGVALVGNPVTVNVTVKPASGATAPTGTVIVTDGGLGDTCAPSPTPLTAGAGTCTLTIAPFTPGPSGEETSLAAAYTPAASSGFLASNSVAAIEQVVEGVVPCGSAFGPVTLPQTNNQQPGALPGTVTQQLTVCLAGNLNLQNVGLAVAIKECFSLSGCSTGMPMPVAGEPGVYTVAITFTASNSSVGSPRVLPRLGGPRAWPLTLFVLAALLTILLALQLALHHRPRLRLLFAAGFLFALLLSGMSGCNGAKTNQNLIPLGTYVVKIQVTAGGVFSATVPVTVNVVK